MKVAKRVFLAAIASLLVTGLALANPPSVGAAASDPPLVHFLVDVSGSMYGSKIQAVRDALTDINPQIPNSTNVGMRFFGTIGCETELRLPIGPHNQVAFSSQVDALGAFGATPLALGLQEAGEDIRSVPASSKTIVLLNDGENNCDGDPCQVAAELAASGIELKINTVGIEIGAGSIAEQTLKCIAQVTGGRYQRLEDADDLTDMLPDLVSPTTLKMVSLGDSFSSGEGTYDYDKHQPALDCHRGPYGWPRLLERRSTQIVEIDHRACTGAKVYDLQGNYKSQIQLDRTKRPDPSVDIVTLTVGGNDLGFSLLAGQMWLTKGNSSTTFWHDMNSALASLSAKLDRLYPEIRRLYPNARIVHVGYPRITPKPGSTTYRCAWLDSGELVFADQLVRRLNTTIANSVARNASVEYVDIYSALEGRELCTPKSLVHPIDLAVFGFPSSPWFRSEQAHPDPLGNSVIADMVLDKIGYN